MPINLCIVTEFEQENFFQWTLAFGLFPKFNISSLCVNHSTLQLYDENDTFWDPIRHADVVFTYCVRHDKGWKWFRLPFEVRKWMKSSAKLICQFDLEFLWLFYPKHYPWDDIDPWSKGKTPEEFFKETGVLEIADAYIIFFNDKLKDFTTKPVYNIPLPQLVRYQLYLDGMPDGHCLKKKTQCIAVLHHSVKSAKIDHTLKNIVQKFSYPVRIFSCGNMGQLEQLEVIRDLPQRGSSSIFGLLPRNVFMEFLSKCYIAIDDNEGYKGWSRFVMECALVHVPCIGSTKMVKELFPELYVEHKNYKKQKALIEKLYTDSNFWIKVAISGKTNVLKILDTEMLVKKFRKVITQRRKSHVSTKKPTRVQPISFSMDWNEYKKYKAFCIRHFPKSIPKRPTKGELGSDAILRDIITQENWDKIYGKWKKFIDGYIPPKVDFSSPAEDILQPMETILEPTPILEIPKMDDDEILERKFTKKDRSALSDVSKTLTIVIAIRDRSANGIRVKSFFKSLKNQTDTDFKIIVVDYGSIPRIRKELFKLCKKYGATYFFVDADKWHSPRALNIGIGRARTNYVIQTQPDMIFRKDFIKKVKEKLGPNNFVWSVPTFLNKDAYRVLDGLTLNKDWNVLNNNDYWWTTWNGHGYGAIQCMPRKWFIEVGGYEEAFRPYGPPDWDLWERAKKDGMNMVCIEKRDESVFAMYAHQWHPKSKYFRQMYFTPERKIVNFIKLVGKEIIKKSDVFHKSSRKFSIVIPVSRGGEQFDRCLRSVSSQNADEIRAYVDPIKLKGKARMRVIEKLLNINAKVFLQALTSDSDESKCRKKQLMCANKILALPYRSLKNRFNNGKRLITIKFLRARAYSMATEMFLSGISYKKIIAKLTKHLHIPLTSAEIKSWCEGHSKPSLGTDWNIHHSAHPDCVRNVHRAIMECEHKWVIRVDDDDEILVHIQTVLNKYADNDIGIIHGDVVLTKEHKLSILRGQQTLHTDVSQIRGSVVILNRDAIREVHINILHKPWQDFRRWYWILRTGYKAVYIPLLFGHVHQNLIADPIRLAEGGTKTWNNIAIELNNKPLRLDI